MVAIKIGKFEPKELDQLFMLLSQAGYKIIGPKLENQAIIYSEIHSLSDLPKGIGDYQEKGTYRIRKRSDDAYFGYNLGSDTFKRFLFLPKEPLFKIAQGGEIQTLSLNKIKKQALLGVRACELHAIQIQDKVFLSDNYHDPHYLERRKQTLIISLNCHTAANTCFCVSMDTGPALSTGYDLNLSEIITDTAHYFLCEVGSETGLTLFNKLSTFPVTEQDLLQKKEMTKRTTQKMGRTLDTFKLKEKLEKSHNHLDWEKVAEVCINCSNCALSCPTCFCSSTQDTVSIEDKKVAERVRVWDTCFSQNHSYIHNHNIRHSPLSRYRQWLTHKLGTWHDQFGVSGCVGCGHCITWCPVGIDLTEIAKNLSENENEKT